MQHETALHSENDMGKALSVGADSIGRISCQRSGSSGIQRAKAKRARWTVNLDGEEIALGTKRPQKSFRLVFPGRLHSGNAFKTQRHRQ
jgi:hypothetical protein